MVLRVALWQILIGLGLGTPAALFSGHPDGEPTYGVGSSEPAVFVSATVVLGLYATVAGLIPSHRAASIETHAGAPCGVKHCQLYLVLAHLYVASLAFHRHSPSHGGLLR